MMDTLSFICVCMFVLPFLSVDCAIDKKGKIQSQGVKRKMVLVFIVRFFGIISFGFVVAIFDIVQDLGAILGLFYLEIFSEI